MCSGPLYHFIHDHYNAVTVTEPGLRSDPVQYVQLSSESGLLKDRDPLSALEPNLFPIAHPGSS